MINPYRGILLEGRYYNYENDSFKEGIQLKNASTNTQNSRTFAGLGGTLPSFTITLHLENTYEVYAGSTSEGSTTWLGVSRKDDFQKLYCVQGNSLPLTFVSPYGVTYSVVPIGAIDYDIFNSSNPQSVGGVEFRATISFDASI